MRSKISNYMIFAVLLCTTLILMTACSSDEAPSPMVESVTAQGMETPAPALSQPAPVETQPSVPETGLLQAGPWILFSTESGLWGMNEDGSGQTQLTTERIVAPSDLSTGLSQGNPHFAYITASDPASLQGLALNLLTLPEGTVKTITPLSSAETEPQANAETCDPNYEAARAATIRNSLAWSLDGSKLAFTASLDGPTADVYVYSLQDESITRLSDEPGQAYDLHWNWLPESETVAYFSASCFGAGAGFDMEGAWTTRLSTAKAEQVYQPNPESWDEAFITWVFGQEAFLVATVSGCPYRDLRMVDLDTKEITPIFEGCFENVETGPTSSLAVLTSSDLSDQPGLYLYAEPDTLNIPPVYIPEASGREVRHLGVEFFISIAGEGDMEIRSLGWDGRPGWYQGRGGFPAVSKDGEAWAWNESDVFYLKNNSMDVPAKLSDDNAMYPFWYEDITPSGEIYQRMLFFDGQNNLHMISSPDYQPVLLAGSLAPLSAPVQIYPSSK